MFRSSRWRSDKKIIKALFKLHFHATHVFQSSGVDAFVLSIVPSNIGKTTMRLEKTRIQDGFCKWENPIHECVKFVQDPKTGKISDKIYHFLVSTGLSKASSIGEVSINFADYVDATIPSFLSLPMKNSQCDAVLHISIQRLPENSGQREEDECEDAKIKSQDRSIMNHLRSGDIDESTRSYSSEDVSVKAMINRPELSSNSRTSSGGSDITLSCSDDSSGLDTPCDLGLRKMNIHPDTNGFLSGTSHTSEPQKPAVNSPTTVHDVHHRSHWDWSSGSERRLSVDDSTNGSHDVLLQERSQHASPMEIDRLRAELADLARQVNVSDMELQTLRKQIVKESKRGQDLTKEIIELKEENGALKTECDNLRLFHKRMDEAKLRNRSHLEGGDLRAFVEEIRQELNYEKDLNANLRLQLNKMQESNAELVLAVQDLDEMLEQKNREMCNLSNNSEQVKNSKQFGINLSKCESDDDEEQKALDKLVKEHTSGKDTNLLEKKIIDLYGEIEMYRRDKDELEMQMEQLALDYEILKQENHGLAYKLEQSQLQEQLKMQYECSSPPPEINDTETRIKNLEDQLKEQSEDFSNSLATIKALETHIRKLEEELEKQSEGFEADLEAVTHCKVEQEQRAIQAEEALRKTRLKNANTAERLQEEFRRLSTQMTSTFDANEKAAMKALTEASELRAQKSILEGMLHKVKEENQSLKAEYEVKLKDLSNQIDTMTVHKQQMFLEIEDKSKRLEIQNKNCEQVSRDFSEEIEMLKAENEKLKEEISRLSEQVAGSEIFRSDLELMKKSVEESEALLQRRTVERNELVSKIASLKNEAEQSLDEFNKIRHHTDENEREARVLRSELESVRAQYSDLKHFLDEDEAEKEKLRKQVLQLKAELKKKDDGAKTSPKNKKTASVPQNSKEMASLREKIRMLEGLIKSKESAMETSTTTFLEKEKELQTKIKELENKVEEFNQSIALPKIVQDRSTNTSNDICGEVRSTVEPHRDNGCASEENMGAFLFKSIENLAQKETATTLVIDSAESNVNGILSELKERNKSMENELKEMQERYSEMSLKFAEVEGERQQLVMTVRNLKSIHKG
ncbi:hypothetical protein TanjilG_22096 [Lupinus angustifolius]|uniref:C2 NT-type domain-containing protein n=2 Tax=Lupinus angustifolius TaxID=3871 RepID=A0A4P1QTV9_LUPAN|nr:PREDICTED: putative leucine-rich repeat-containing protein DDB_G0290503 isoform X1 [Lupinus angustifolius]OIV94899.1 hypothetical protein TanjilG_22096 [Lupinus angustifolius]